MSINDAYNNVFSGSDVVIIFGNEYVGEAMSFTVGVNREAGLVHVLGRKQPIAVAKGKRGVGGSFILAQLGFDALIDMYKNIVGTEKAKNPIWIRKDEQVEKMSDKPPGKQTTSAGGSDLNTAINATDIWVKQETPNYADQLPPFDVTVIGRNEQGRKMGFRVNGITIINEGMAISIEELNMEKRYTFIAQSVSPMVALTT